MKVKDILQVSQKSDRLIVANEKNEILYIGYIGMMEYKDNSGFEEQEVQLVTYKQDLIGRDDNGVFKPLEPDTVPDVIYSNIEERLYLYIRVKN